MTPRSPGPVDGREATTGPGHTAVGIFRLILTMAALWTIPTVYILTVAYR